MTASLPEWAQARSVITLHAVHESGACADGLAAFLAEHDYPAQMSVAAALAATADDADARAVVVKAARLDGYDGAYGDGDGDGYDSDGVYGDGDGDGYGYGYGYGYGGYGDGYSYGYGGYGDGDGDYGGYGDGGGSGDPFSAN